MSFVVIIPARFASTRLPGKPLLDIGGKPMIQHVYERAVRSGADTVIIATDDRRIADVGRALGAEIEMTSAEHHSGTDRLAEVVASRNLGPDTVVVNVQGDEPFIPPALIGQVARRLEVDDQAVVATLCEPIVGVDDVFNPAVVKVVFDDSGRALYFSRAPIPWHRDAFSVAVPGLPTDRTYFRHLGIYAYRASYLATYVSLPRAELEMTESLEQLRVLANGDVIAIAVADESTGPGIDTYADLERARRLVETEQCPPPSRS